VLANGKRWASLTPDLQAMITKNVTDAVMKQRDDIRRLNNGLEAQLKAKGLAFNYPENKSFRDTLSKAGFYKEWRGKFGDEAMAQLEKYSGKLA